MQPQGKLATMLPTRKPHQPKSPQSSNRGFVVFRRKPVLPRLDVYCPLGKSNTAVIEDDIEIELADSLCSIVMVLLACME